MTETRDSAMPSQKKRKTQPESSKDENSASSSTSLPASPSVSSSAPSSKSAHPSKPVAPKAVTLPPLQPYPHVVSIMPTQCYPVYSPYYLPVTSPLSPVPTTSSPGAPFSQKILPKNGPGSDTHSTPVSPSCFHPFSFQISPQLLPSASSVPGQVGRQHSTADEREQARKVSHSAIERRRRERINDKIAQLKQLIPSCASQDNLHKMSVLQSAIDYITYLKDIVDKADPDDSTTRQKPMKAPVRPVFASRPVQPSESQADEDAWSASSGSSPSPACSASQGDETTLSPLQDKKVQGTDDDSLHSTPRPTSTPIQQAECIQVANGSPTEIPTRRLTPMDIIKQHSFSAVGHSHHLTSQTCELPPPLLAPVDDPSPAVVTKNMSLKNLLCQ